MTHAPTRNSKFRRQGLYNGNLPFLMEIVRLTKVPGQWQKMQNYLRYCCDNGAIFNWWPSTGTFNFQGPTEQKERFALKMATAAFENVDPLDQAVEAGAGVSNYHIPILSDEGES